jgi:hypothetical protein
MPTFGALGFVPGAKPVSPHHVFVAVLDQVAAERERQLEVLVRERVGEGWPTSVGVAPVPHSMRVGVTSAGACAIAR